MRAAPAHAGRVVITAVFTFSTLAMVLSGPPPEAGNFAWFFAPASPVSRLAETPRQFSHPPWVVPSAVAPLVLWLVSRPLSGAARRRAVLYWITSLLPVSSITLCMALGVAVEAGGLDPAVSTTLLLGGFTLSGLLQSVVLAGLDSWQRPVLGGSILSGSGLLTAGAASITALILEPLAPPALRWVDQMLNPNKVPTEALVGIQHPGTARQAVAVSTVHGP